jgi:hypothetical protein
MGPTGKSLPNNPSHRKFPNLFVIHFSPLSAKILTKMHTPHRIASASGG